MICTSIGAETPKFFVDCKVKQEERIALPFSFAVKSRLGRKRLIDSNHLVFQGCAEAFIDHQVREEIDHGVEVDPILWTKKGPSLATPLPAFLTGNVGLLLIVLQPSAIACSPGETEAGSAGEQPAKG